MKAKVVKRFFGIAEDKQYEVGDEFEGTKERIEAINDVLPGTLEVIPTRTTRKKTTKADE